MYVEFEICLKHQKLNLFCRYQLIFYKKKKTPYEIIFNKTSVRKLFWVFFFFFTALKCYITNIYCVHYFYVKTITHNDFLIKIDIFLRVDNVLVEINK